MAVVHNRFQAKGAAMEVELNDLRFPTWPIGAVVLVVLLIILWRRKCCLSYLLCCGLFGIYLLFAADRAFFPIAISGTYADTMRTVPFALSINLIPFNFNLLDIPDIVLLQIL